MRGDSVRDFYAKTLAVMGLGLIAGAGAMVDYWPVARPLPDVDRLALLAEPRALPAPPNQDIPLPAAAAVPVRVQAEARSIIRPDHIEWPTFVEPQELVIPVVARVMPPAPAVPAIDTAVAPPSLDIVTQVGQPVALVAYAMAPPEPEIRSSGPVAQDHAGQPGFIGGALKKTRDSIVRTGAVTGASIADAFKGLFGALKKASPF